VITLKNNQKLLGSGVAQAIKTNFGTVYAPATIRPILSNFVMIGTYANQSIISLANNNVVSGFSFPEIDLNPIPPPIGAISGIEITNATIQNNSFNFVDSDNQQILYFSGCDGTITVSNNTLSDPVMNSESVAIQIGLSANSPVTYNISGNNYVSDPSEIDTTFLWFNSTSVTTSVPTQLNVIGNTISTCQYGIYDTAISSTSDQASSLQITGNSFNNVANAIFLFSVAGPAKIGWVNNFFSATQDADIAILGGQVVMQVNGNIFSHSTAQPNFTITTSAPSSTCLQLNYNQFDRSCSLNGNTGAPLYLETPRGNTGTINEVDVTNLPPGQTCQ
jgi:hypothetical protein